MKPVSPDVSFPELEHTVLNFWREHNTFQKSLDADLPGPQELRDKNGKRKSYVFYDGPPFATGLPHYGHLLAGTIKDVIGRFFTMKGYTVDRRFGWDCHGVPVEFEIQKKLNLYGAKAIREFGVPKFNEECRKIVLRYTEEWEKFVERSGRWVDFERQYRTMDSDFMESVWWALRSLWDRGLIYKSVKSVPYSWAINTPLSNFEANLNYKQVQDPAVIVRMELLSAIPGVDLAKGKRVTVYIWTTTPWTLPANLAIAVGEDIDYVLVENSADNELAIVAESRANAIFPALEQASDSQTTLKVVAKIKGKDLVGLEYKPLFPYFEKHRSSGGFKIYSAEFVTTEEGTGLVHLASFGEDDVKLFLAHDLPIVDPVDEDGNFVEPVTEFLGLNIKDADPLIIKNLKERGLLVRHETIEHSYPFCWRTDKPLIYKAIASWFVAVEKFRDELQQINSLIHWVPGHLKDGRFGKWLENARDWAISRNRFWGTPIPIWTCDKCEHLHCFGSVAELEAKAGRKVEDLHCHFIDDIKFACSACSAGTMQRIPEVLDCWFESGAMPYAQAHYPFEGKEQFEDNFPADFIAEGLDQTRGWFYTLLVLSTALFGRPAFKNVVVNGIVLAEDGKKMSKSLQNYPPPDEVMDEFGADAMRLYLLSSSATRAEDLRFSKAGVREVVRQTLLPLWNSYNFFTTYALVDNWSVDKIPNTQSQNVLDRWILSKAGSLIEGVNSAFTNYHLFAATQPILEFVDQLTNWYIRLNRRRFWAGNTAEEREDKLHAYATLYRVLTVLVRVIAPLAPFMSEAIYRNLSSAEDNEDVVESVHLLGFPTLAELGGATIDAKLEHAMELFEEVILLGRSLRNSENLRVRQPLSVLKVIHREAEKLKNLSILESYICEELNVKRVEYSTEEDRYVTLEAQLDMKKVGGTLGPKLGSKGMKSLRDKIAKLSSVEIVSIEAGDKFKFEGEEFGAQELLIRRQAKKGVGAVLSSGQVTIALDTQLTPELRLEGLAREFVNRVQKLRKDSGYEVQDRIALRYMSACPQLSMALDEYRNYIMSETLALDIIEERDEDTFIKQSEIEPTTFEIAGKAVIIGSSKIVQS